MLTDLLEKFERYLRVLLALSPSSVRSYMVKVVEFTDWLNARAGGQIDPEAIERADVEDFLEHLYYRGNSNVTRRAKLTAIQHFSRFMVYERLTREDFTAMIPRPKVPRKFVQKFSKEEVYRFFRACDITTEIGLRDACILILLVFCGMRNGEVCDITLDDVIDDGGNIDINITDEIGKHGSSRSIYLWKAPSLLIRQWYSTRLAQGAGSRDPFIVSYRKGLGNQGNPLSQKDIDRRVKFLARRAGIRKARKHAHMFRATHCSDLRHIKGYDLPAIAERAGHKDISTTDNYISRRDRIHRQYPSLAAYWSEFPNLWTVTEEE